MSDETRCRLTRTVEQQIAEAYWPGYVHGYPHKRAYRLFDQETRVLDFWNYEPRFLNVYVHVPFCSRKCGFCNLFSMAINRERSMDTVDAYCDAIQRQLRFYSPGLNQANVLSIYFGGGTPNLLSIDQLESIMSAIRSSFSKFDDSLEACIECSPEFLDEEYVRGLARIGFGRISVGVQSFDEVELEHIRRDSNLSHLMEIFSLCQEVGLHTNVDLIYGLPAQSQSSLVQNIERGLSLSPDNITLYPLALREHTLVHDRLAHLCASMNEKYDLYDVAATRLAEAGFFTETVVRFVRGEYSSYQQQKLEFAGVETLGLGAGARSYAGDVHYSMPYRMGHKVVRHFVDSFIDCNDFDALRYEGFVFNEDERKRKLVILTLLGSGLDCAAYENRFGEPVNATFAAELAALQDNEMLQHDDNGVLKLSPRGRKYSDIAAHLFYSDQVRSLEQGFTLT